MKRPYPKSLKFRLIVCFFLLCAAFIINSCRKDNTAKQQPDILNTGMVNMAKKWYTATYPEKSGTVVTQSTGGNQDWTRMFSPYWDKASTFGLDTLTFIELPALKKGNMAMSMKPGIDPKSFNFNNSGSLTSIIIVNKHGNFYVYAMTILADSSYLKGNYGKVPNNTYRHRDKDFTGYVFYNRLNGEFVNGWRYTNGVITGVINQAPVNNTGIQIQSINKKQVDVAEETDCQTTITTIYWESCDYYTNDYEDAHPFNCYDYTTSSASTVCYTVPSTGGGSSTQTPCTIPGNSDSSQTVEDVKNIIAVADPNPPGGTGSGGIVDQINNIGTNGCKQKSSVQDTTKTTTPCNQVHHVDSLAQKSIKDTIYNRLVKDTYTGNEYGDEENLTTWPPNGTYKETPLRTSFDPTNFVANFTWDSKNGYTININHDHPAGDAPSPGDVFTLIADMSNTNFRNAGATALNYYIKNASVTVVTKTATYIVTIANYDALKALSIEYNLNVAQFNKNYDETAID